MNPLDNLDSQNRSLVNQLKMARYATGLSQKAVADLIHGAPATVNNLENGHRAPSRKTIEALIQVYQSKGIEFGPDGWVRLKEQSQ